MLAVLLNIISSIGLFYEYNNIFFIVSYSLKGFSIGSLISLAFHMLANKEHYKIQK